MAPAKAERAWWSTIPLVTRNIAPSIAKAASSLPVAQFVLGLRERELFRNVELKTGGRIAAASTALASYVVECWF